MSTDLIPALSAGPFSASPIGMIVADGPVPEFEIFLEYGKGLRRVKSAIQWVIGDWLRFGEFSYGEKYVQATAIWPESEMKTLMGYQWIADAYPKLSSRRHCSPQGYLTWTHYREVAAVEEPLRSQLLDEANEKEWTVGELRKQRDIAIKGFATMRYVTCPDCGNEFQLKGARYLLVNVTE